MRHHTATVHTAAPVLLVTDDGLRASIGVWLERHDDVDDVMHALIGNHDFLPDLDTALQDGQPGLTLRLTTADVALTMRLPLAPFLTGLAGTHDHAHQPYLTLTFLAGPPTSTADWTLHDDLPALGVLCVPADTVLDAVTSQLDDDYSHHLTHAVLGCASELQDCAHADLLNSPGPSDDDPVHTLLDHVLVTPTTNPAINPTLHVDNAQLTAARNTHGQLAARLLSNLLADTAETLHTDAHLSPHSAEPDHSSTIDRLLDAVPTATALHVAGTMLADSLLVYLHAAHAPLLPALLEPDELTATLIDELVCWTPPHPQATLLRHALADLLDAAALPLGSTVVDDDPTQLAYDFAPARLRRSTGLNATAVLTHTLTLTASILTDLPELTEQPAPLAVVLRQRAEQIFHSLNVTGPDDLTADSVQLAQAALLHTPLLAYLQTRLAGAVPHDAPVIEQLTDSAFLHACQQLRANTAAVRSGQPRTTDWPDNDEQLIARHTVNALTRALIGGSAALAVHDPATTDTPYLLNAPAAPYPPRSTAATTGHSRDEHTAAFLHAVQSAYDSRADHTATDLEDSLDVLDSVITALIETATHTSPDQAVRTALDLTVDLWRPHLPADTSTSIPLSMFTLQMTGLLDIPTHLPILWALRNCHSRPTETLATLLGAIDPHGDWLLEDLDSDLLTEHLQHNPTRRDVIADAAALLHHAQLSDTRPATLKRTLQAELSSTDWLSEAPDIHIAAVVCAVLRRAVHQHLPATDSTNNPHTGDAHTHDAHTHDAHVTDELADSLDGWAQTITFASDLNLL